MITVLIFIVILTLLVLIHEAGHFFVAKLFNIKVEEFGVGFPPRAWGRKIGETVYSINWLPIGGFVKLYGEDSAGGGQLKIKDQVSRIKNSDRAFFAKPWWQRALVVVAGVVMNFVLAVVITSFLFAVVGVGVPKDVVISTISEGSPAASVGLKPGDSIEYINNTKIISTQQLISETKKYLGREITLKVKSPTAGSGQANLRDIKVTPRTESPQNQGPLGVAISQNFETKKYPWYKAGIIGTQETLKNSWLIVSAFGTVISQLVTQGAVPKDVAGPIGIAQITGQVVEVGPFAVLSLIAILSLNLAILNVLPIPALDGGRLFFILVEAVTRKKVHPKFEGYVHAVGMALLLALILLITLHDITRVFSGQSIIPK